MVNQERGTVLRRILVRHTVRRDLNVRWFINSLPLILARAASESRKHSYTGKGWLPSCNQEAGKPPHLLLNQNSLLTAFPPSIFTLPTLLSTAARDAANKRVKPFVIPLPCDLISLRAKVKKESLYNGLDGHPTSSHPSSLAAQSSLLPLDSKPSSGLLWPVGLNSTHCFPSLLIFPYPTLFIFLEVTISMTHYVFTNVCLTSSECKLPHDSRGFNCFCSRLHAQ